ncbi:hypothetical protein OYT1_ch2281 [Ferriphaselus amnicola]|uniref:DUF2752 domain-containing protein n=1 Tax=Ferriphaselus amnicola TaxID=1188319 RepID=A0A2Z6GED4_9PROT|nr:hypothetical protein [Ferriphaselus amnicola]BBE51797.1 hypothetical protein OYT1_ch2281 [Ferriphaselus amnicola]
MKTSCPACGATASLDVLLGNEGAREAVMAALAMPAPIGKLLIQYLGLFRPAHRNLSFDRVATLLNELLPLIAEAKIERNGRVWSAPQDYWRMALEEMLAKRETLTLPLKSHGYLLTIIAGYSSKAEAVQEAQSENTRAGRTPVGSVAARQPVAPAQPEQKRTPIPESVKAELGRLKTKTHP